MKKVIVLFSLISIFTSNNLFSQFVEVEINSSKGLKKGLKIEVQGLSKEVAYQTSTEYVVEKDNKAIPSYTSLNELFFDNANLSIITPASIDLYFVFQSNDKSLVVLIDNGNDFVSSSGQPNLALNMQKLCGELKQKLEIAVKNNYNDSIKKNIAKLEAELDLINQEIKSTGKEIKSDTKSAQKDEKTATKTEEKLIETNKTKAETENNLNTKKAEYDAFPLADLQNEIKTKNKTIKKTKKANKKLAKANLKKQNQIAKLQNEINTNNGTIKSNQTTITNDSSTVVTNEKKIEDFNPKARKKELKKLEGKKEKLEDKTKKQEEKITENKQEAEQKKKEAEQASQKQEELKKKQEELKSKIEIEKAKIKS